MKLKQSMINQTVRRTNWHPGSYVILTAVGRDYVLTYDPIVKVEEMYRNIDFVLYKEHKHEPKAFLKRLFGIFG